MNDPYCCIMKTKNRPQQTFQLPLPPSYWFTQQALLPVFKPSAQPVFHPVLRRHFTKLVFPPALSDLLERTCSSSAHRTWLLFKLPGEAQPPNRYCYPEFGNFFHKPTRSGVAGRCLPCLSGPVLNIISSPGGVVNTFMQFSLLNLLHPGEGDA